MTREKEVEAPGGIEPPLEGFADPRLPTWLRRLMKLPQRLNLKPTSRDPDNFLKKNNGGALIITNYLLVRQ